MSPDLLFLLSLAVKMAVTALFVLVATYAAERAGALVGAMIATLPIAAGPAYIFLALDHDARFIADSALASLVVNAVTCIFALVYAVLAQKRGLAASVLPALAVWFALALVVRAIPGPRQAPSSSTSWCSRSASCSAIASVTPACRSRCGAGTTFRCAPAWWRS